MDLLREGGSRELRDDPVMASKAFVKLDTVKMHLPAVIPDYTDFYSSRDHAFNCGCMFRDPANALQPNWLHLPVGYHGRASTVFVSGTEIVRPRGQLQKDKGDPKKGSEYGPCKNLDFEMEIAFFVGGEPLRLGETITMDNVEDRIFGLVLMNDWSARDIQSWEYVPLGPFGSKNFATSISPWIVPYEALKPFTCETISRVQQDPEPLDYLKDPNYSSFDIDLTVSIQGQDMPQAEQVCRTNMRNLYWNIKQQLVHHTVTGCRMRPGDLLGTGTISGGEQDSLGSLLEMSWRGTRDVPLGSSGENRKFLKDFDKVIMRGKCQNKVQDSNGNERILSLGFGECNGKIFPAGSIIESNPAHVHLEQEVLAAHGVSQVASMGARRFHTWKLYGYWRSSCTWRVRIALAAKGIKYEYVPIDISKGDQHDSEHENRNRMRQVPTLEVYDEEAKTKRLLSQSLAIIEFLEETFPNSGCSMLPKDPIERMRVRQISEIINSGIQPLQNLSVLKAISSNGQMDSKVCDCVLMKSRMIKIWSVNLRQQDWAHKAISKGLEAVEVFGP